jgi:hypothetical protein
MTFNRQGKFYERLFNLKINLTVKTVPCFRGEHWFLFLLKKSINILAYLTHLKPENLKSKIFFYIIKFAPNYDRIKY